MAWNAYVDIKANGKLNDSQWEEVKNWAEVEQVWSTSGSWDWLVKFKESVSDLNKLEKIVFNLRTQPWVSETRTWWGKAV